MRPVKDISDIENFRIEILKGFQVIRRNSIEPEPIGTIILKAFRIIGYDKNCDGSLMARLENIDKNGDVTGWDVTNIGLYSESSLVVTQDELKNLFEKNKTNK